MLGDGKGWRKEDGEGGEGGGGEGWGRGQDRGYANMTTTIAWLFHCHDYGCGWLLSPSSLSPCH